MLDKILAFVKLSSGAPAAPEARAPAPAAFRDRLQLSNGFPIADWTELAAAVDALPEERRAQAWLDHERAWLLHFRDALGPAFELRESETALLLSSLEPRAARAVLDYMGRTLKRVGAVLQGIAEAPPWGKDILVVFDDEESYYRYVSHYYPEKGEFAFSGGMHIGAGCSHFVAPRKDLREIEPTIAHEMTHGCLAHLPLPLWLNEGLAVNVEQRLAGRGAPLYTPEQMHAKHERFWTPDSARQFWSGESFDRTDEGNMLSYDLARIIVGQLAGDWPRFARFVLEADRSDGGAAAARKHLGMELDSIIPTLLEKEWSSST
jgi:hypothetical protein